MHSATKYLNGHDDVVAGALATRADDALWERIGKVRPQIGTALGPFEAWLLMRGISTLDVRVRRQATTAARPCRAACWAIRRSATCSIPDLRAIPATMWRARQMKGGFGGDVVRCVIRAARKRRSRLAAAGDAVEARDITRRRRKFDRTPCVDRRRRLALPDDLLRFSVGLENVDELYLDLVHALSIVG